MRADRVAAALLATLAITLVSPVARAHFVLMAPQSWAQQDSQGNPQKSAPCGQADPQIVPVPTHAVTALTAGQTFTVTVDETTFHPGHYRVVLSTTGQGGLPPDPATTLPGTCMELAIEDPPVFPVLADGMLVHTDPFAGPQSFQVTLPQDVTCTSCTLQVLEFMSAAVGASGNCFYHHCANVSIAAAAEAPDAGASDAAPATDAGRDTGHDAVGDGCACRIGEGGHAPAGFLWLLALGGLRRRRSR